MSAMLIAGGLGSALYSPSGNQCIGFGGEVLSVAVCSRASQQVASWFHISSTAGISCVCTPCTTNLVLTCSLPIHAAAAATAKPPAHPVWGVVNPNISGYVRLLMFLSVEQVKRLRVWTDPLQYADPYAETPKVRAQHVCVCQTLR